MPKIKRHLPSVITLLTLLALSACGDDDATNKGNTRSEKAPYTGKMNISWFVYRDTNRNGRYDLADRPYAGQLSRLTRPDESVVSRTSNISGFTNYRMSRDNEVFPIHVAGSYALESRMDETMVVTSGNPTTSLNIESLDDSPGGLVAKPTLIPLGVAPRLTVQGSVSLDPSLSSDDYRLQATHADGTNVATGLNEEGNYLFEAKPGTWQLSVSDGSRVLYRGVEVTDQAVQLASINLNGPQTTDLTEEPATTIRFDDLTTSDTLYEIPNGYSGLDWHNWIATHHKLYKGAGYINNTLSGEFTAYNSSGHPAIFSSEQPFDLEQLYIGVAWEKAESNTITIRAWRGGELAYEDSFSGSTSRPLQFNANYRQIDKVEISTSHYWQVVVDDLTIRR